MSDQMILIIFGLAFLSCIALWIGLELNDIYQTRAEKQGNDWSSNLVAFQNRPTFSGDFFII